MSHTRTSHVSPTDDLCSTYEYRFPEPDLPREFYSDWILVASEEAKHYAGVLQCVAVCVAVVSSVLQHVAACCCVLQCVAMCGSVLLCVAV